jgi:sulfur carrier protein ThiS
MHIKVNRKTVEIFSGARVKDVLRKYSAGTWKQVQQGSKAVCDGHGHEVGLDGELGDGDRLVVKRAARKETRP